MSEKKDWGRVGKKRVREADDYRRQEMMGAQRE